MEHIPTQYLNSDTFAGAIDYTARLIRAGGLVAFPTETVYGLGANALNAAAVAKIYMAKQRALNDPLIVHCALPDSAVPTSVGNSLPIQIPTEVGTTKGITFLEYLTQRGIIGELSPRQRALFLALAVRFMPGPLTLVLPRGSRIPLNVTAGLDTVAVRVPDHPIALALIRRSGVPIAAPSANRFGHVSPTRAQHVLDDLDGRINLVLDGGPTTIGVESTVLDLTSDAPRILRPGGLPRERIEEVCGKLDDTVLPLSADDVAHTSPGMLNRHYAPQATLRVVRDLAELLRVREALVARGLHVGLLLLTAQRDACAGLDPQFVLGSDVTEVARNLYAGMRAIDSQGVEIILISEVERSGLGEAIADRLRRGGASLAGSVHSN